MKKLIAVALMFCLLIPAAVAEDIDLSKLSFDELVVLRNKCQTEMMKRDTWQEVTVPQGLWEVGKDIPAGTWTIKCSGIGETNYLLKCTEITISDKLNEYKTDVIYSSMKYESFSVYNPNSEYYDGEATEATITVKKGDYISINIQYNSAIFTPYTGKPNLGFK